MIRLKVDGKDVEAWDGENLFEVCRENGIYIPGLCHMKGMKNPPASCRLCFVEIEGKRGPVASCKTMPEEGMVVRTDTPPVRRLQKTALRLLLSAHEADCRNCPSNKKCELQRMVRLLGVRLRPRRFEHLGRELPAREDHPLLEILPSRCVLCGRCVHVCRERHGLSMLTFVRRGFHSVIRAYGPGNPGDYPCKDCLACVEVCPVSAILLKEVAAPETDASFHSK